MRAHAFVAAVAAVLAGTAGAQSLPPIHTLGGVLATSVDSLGAVVPSVRALPGGGVLVNDVLDRRLILFDSTLHQTKIVADSTPSTANAYGGRIGGLLAYRGDSSLFVDPASMSMLVVDASGKIARIMSMPRSQDAGFLGAGSAAFDPSGKLVYRGMLRPEMPRRTPDGGFMPPDLPDSAPVLRVDIATRKTDTAAFVKIPKMKLNVSRSDDGRMSITNEINPMPVVDEWGLLPDGTIAIVRGEDYHLDFVSPTGALTKAPKVPYDWQRMTDSDKVAFIDSAKTAIEAARAKMLAAQQSGDRRMAPGAEGMAGAQVMIFSTGPGGARGSNQPPPLQIISPSELPDYRPAPVAGGTRVDPEGNVWVRTSLARPGNGPVYDVIDKTGKLVDRVQVALNKQIVGFGPGGAVYLLEKDGTTYRLQRATTR